MTNTTTPATPDGLADELRALVTPVIGACLLIGSNDPRLTDPRIGVAAEVANAVCKFLAARVSTPLADNGLVEELAEALVKGTRLDISYDQALDAADEAVRCIRSPMPVTAEGVDFESGDLPDYDHPLRPVFESGCTYAVELLAKTLGVEDYEPCDGTEEFDGDLGGTMLNIVTKTWPVAEHGDWIDLRDPQNRTPSQANDAAGKGEVERLRSALQRTHRNFRLLLRGKPVRDVAETEAEVMNALNTSHEGEGA